uniref:Uncharacterized protein n=1 Tax=Cacopsylla melanoneura TaxID=428564 RepID=A0A8D8Q829_9HEMI
MVWCKRDEERIRLSDHHRVAVCLAPNPNITHPPLHLVQVEVPVITPFTTTPPPVLTFNTSSPNKSTQTRTKVLALTPSTLPGGRLTSPVFASIIEILLV